MNPAPRRTSALWRRMSNPKTRRVDNNRSRGGVLPPWAQRNVGVRALEELPVVMVVEDDQSIQGVVEEALSDGGFEPAIAASGEEAVTLLKGCKGKYRALVADVNLRGRMDGWEVAKQAREIDPTFPVIYMTGERADQWA